jgi:iron-sulfur cluster assembly protein
MIHLSPTATHEIGRLKAKQPANILFRLQVKRGGCADWCYDIGFDQVVNAEDQVFDLDGLQIVIDNESLKYINGLSLDYSEDLMGGCFRFHNPQAIATCSCGNSFAISQ